MTPRRPGERRNPGPRRYDPVDGIPVPVYGIHLTDFVVKNIAWIGHFHMAGIPGRHEIFTGETDYRFLLDAVEKTGYDGYFGLEYMPVLPCPETLVKTREYLRY